MLCKAKVAVCYEIRTKHSTQNEHNVELLNVKTRLNVKKTLGFKRLNSSFLITTDVSSCKHSAVGAIRSQYEQDISSTDNF